MEENRARQHHEQTNQPPQERETEADVGFF